MTIATIEKHDDECDAANGSKWWTINKKFIPLKLLYFFFVSGEACTTPYRGIYMKHLGMSTAQTGLILTIERAFSLTAPPISGAITDKTKKPKVVIITLLILASLLTFIMYFIPEEHPHLTNFPRKVNTTKSEVIGNYSNDSQDKFSNLVNSSYDHYTIDCLERINCKESSLNSSNTNASLYCSCCSCPNNTLGQREVEDEFGVTFFSLLFLISISSSMAFGAKSVIESSVLSILGTKNRKFFGQQRLWASIGFGVTTFALGILKDQVESIQYSYSHVAFLPMFVGILICWISSSVITYFLPIKKAPRNTEIKKENKGSIKDVFMKPKVLIFLLLVASYGAGIAVKEIFLFWYAENKLDAPAKIFGLTALIGSFIDIPFCLIAGPLVRKFGHNVVLTFGMLVCVIRLGSYYFITEPWHLIPVESLRGITFGLNFVVMCSYTSKIAPKHLEATTMGIMQATTWGLGYGIGAMCGGFLYKWLGGALMFLFCAIVILGVTLLFALFGLFEYCTKKDEVPNVTSDVDLKFLEDPEKYLDNNTDETESYNGAISPSLKHRHHLLENVVLPTPTASNFSLHTA